ncbi:DUF2278 family protein [Streptomyces sp. NPDC087917]|uniref:DUF2278 family protein n=1 Tax=Streptomyces sp. NPDC087917 TaxID=3155060 RepID=UPI00342F59AE
MPLENHGVLSGTLHRHFRDGPETRGRRFHVNLEVDTPAGRHRCAVDVDDEGSGAGVRWQVFTLGASVLDPVHRLAPGYHELSMSSGSGALDHLRHPALAQTPGCLFVRRPPAWVQTLLDRLDPRRPWVTGSHLEAAAALESILLPGRPVLVFGEPLTEGLGMRNVHRNQGAPYGSRRWADNGTWQDGALLTRRPDGRYDVFLHAFSSQADHTDPDGHPLRGEAAHDV